MNGSRELWDIFVFGDISFNRRHNICSFTNLDIETLSDIMTAPLTGINVLDAIRDRLVHETAIRSRTALFTHAPDLSVERAPSQRLKSRFIMCHSASEY
jgi:hypothetical protein